MLVWVPDGLWGCLVGGGFTWELNDWDDMWNWVGKRVSWETLDVISG